MSIWTFLLLSIDGINVHTLNQCRFAFQRQKKSKWEREGEGKREELKKCRMLLKHAIKSACFVFTSKLMLLLLINCVSEMLVIEEKGATKADYIQWKKETWHQKKKKGRQTNEGDVGNKREIICVHGNLISSIYQLRSSITFNSTLINLLSILTHLVCNYIF